MGSSRCLWREIILGDWELHGIIGIALEDEGVVMILHSGMLYLYVSYRLKS